MTSLLDLIDDTIVRYTHRTLVGAQEVADDLLDIRQAYANLLDGLTLDHESTI